MNLSTESTKVHVGFVAPVVIRKGNNKPKRKFVLPSCAAISVICYGELKKTLASVLVEIRN